ncbi:MAG TPA: heparan-alpha-glucosaminide N-acetyltransferase domain-containing protein [Mucilaginibacter sp.]|nr:heparan-alpha-glucosaminide N-acetyltransferase domain-containing protein [Mucilaginibacter sp.]
MKHRIHAIDIVRGLIMIIMTLDHTRDFLDPGTAPTNMQTTTVLLFFTRWITHFCAPTFVFLAGVSTVLAGQRRTAAELRIFLLKRGAWLILSDILFIGFIFTFDPGYHTLIIEVLSVTGIGMALLALLLRVPVPVISLIAGVIILGHPYVPLPFLTNAVTVFPMGARRSIFEFYAALPWAAVVLLGYVFGQLYKVGFAAEKRRKVLMLSGAIAFALFFVVRLLNHYGDPAPWTAQRNAAHTVLSFLNLTKQAPSLLFLMMTLGPVLLLLVWAEKVKGRLADFCRVYGHVPYFYFLLHLILLRLSNLAFIALSGVSFRSDGNPLVWQAAGFGIPLWAVYPMWAAVVFLLYFPCKWFGEYKRSHSKWWLSYL